MINLQLSKALFNEVYYPYLTDYSHYQEIYYGGAGSGKSVFIAQKLIIKALNDKRKILCIRKTGNSQRESCWRLVLEIISQWKIYDYCKVRLSDMTIELPNGSVFLFKGLDDSEKIKSIVGITDIWIEEATELTEDDYIQLSLRMRAKKEDLQIFLSFNPVSKTNWVYRTWFTNDSKVNSNTFILKTTYKNNRFLPKSYIDKLEELIRTNPTYHKIYALGDFCSLEKLIFNNWKVEDFDHNSIRGDLLIGLDFGFSNDTTALIASILDETNKKIYVFKEWGNTNHTNPQIAEVIKYLGFSKSLIIADSAEPKSIKEIKEEGIQRIKAAVKGPDSIKHGIQQLLQYEIIVHPSCKKVRVELENYSWKKDKKSGEYINEPIDEWNHYIDALRYSLQCSKNKLRTLDKNVL